jgi:hypothetical protein
LAASFVVAFVTPSSLAEFWIRIVRNRRSDTGPRVMTTRRSSDPAYVAR